MTIINDSTVVVSSSTELKEVLEKDNNYTYIYFDSNITLDSGIAISSSKTKVTINGLYNGITHEFIDQKKLGTGDAIRVTSPNTVNVIVKNLNITGYNYYGVIYVPETDTYKNTCIEYNNINYIGPQISFNPVGTTRFIDSNITIQENYAAGNEVAECNKIEIGGNTTIVHKSTSNSSFWFRNTNPSLTILKDANVNFTSENRELIYGTNNLELTILPYATFNITTHDGIGYGNNGTGKTLIDTGAKLSIKQTSRNGSYATWYSYGTITMNNDSSLYIINDFSNITSANYNIYFQSSNSGLILNSPKEVVLYNSSANILNTNSTIPFSFSYSRLNLFDKVITIDSNIIKDTLPTYSWYKDTDLSSIDGTFTSSKVTISNNNYTEEELAKLPDLSNFNFVNKKILSIGTFPIHINPLTDQDTTIKGITGVNDSILIEYNDVSTVVVADELGNFNYTYDSPLDIGTIITFNVKKYNDLIYFTKVIQIVYSGELRLDSDDKNFKFKVVAIKENPILCPRLNNIILTVTDSRINSTDWKLYATINHDLMSDDGIILKDSLVFVNDADEIKVLSSVPTLVYTGEKNDGSIKVTDISWVEDKGILLALNDPLENNVEYKAEITWTLEE